MPWTFNPFTGNFDLKGSGGGGGASYIDGEVQNFSALPQTVGTPPVDSAYLVREAEGTWLINRKPAGIYIRTANTGVRASDWTHAGAFPDVFNDANFILYNNADSTKNLAFQLSGITSGQTRTLTAPNASGTIALTSQLAETRIYTSNDTWSKPAGAKLVHVFLVGGGGGGGSGRRGDNATNAGGGGGGSGGGMWVGWVDPGQLGPTETVTIGAGGTGGANRANNNSDGLSGANGSSTSFGTIAAPGGGSGSGGTSSAGGGGGGTGASDSVTFYGTVGARGSGGAGGFTANASASLTRVFFPPGGGGGGGKASTTYYLGGAGGGVGTATFSTAGKSATTNAAGTNGTASFQIIGVGASGGSPGASGQGNIGGDGFLGSGGGGGSAALNDAGGTNTGGAGGNGLAIITTYF